MIISVAAGHVVARARDRVVVLVNGAVALPRLHQQLVRALGQIRARRPQIVVPHAQVHQKIHRSPDAPAPVVLILETRHVARNRGQSGGSSTTDARVEATDDLYLGLPRNEMSPGTADSSEAIPRIDSVVAPAVFLGFAIAAISSDLRRRTTCTWDCPGTRCPPEPRTQARLYRESTPLSRPRSSWALRSPRFHPVGTTA